MQQEWDIDDAINNVREAHQATRALLDMTMNHGPNPVSISAEGLHTLLLMIHQKLDVADACLHRRH